MKRAVLAGMLAAALPLLAQTDGGWRQFDLFGGSAYNGAGSTLNISPTGAGIRVSGTASGIQIGGGGGYVIDIPQNLEFSGRSRLKIRVSGIRDTDKFDAWKLLKLELNNTARITETTGMRNGNDPLYINARNGEAEYDISLLRNIRKLDLVFFNLTVAEVKIEVFYQ
jgi:hypothetical protein